MAEFLTRLLNPIGDGNAAVFRGELTAISEKAETRTIMNRDRVHSRCRQSA